MIFFSLGPVIHTETVASGSQSTAIPVSNSLHVSPPVLSSYTVEGLQRTHPEVLKPFLDPYVGKPYTSSNEQAMIQSLRSLGLFHSITLLPEPLGPEQVKLHVQLEEKWTLIPIPMGGATSGGNVYGGLFLFESNLFGWNKKFFGGAFYGNTVFQGMIGYIDPRFFGSYQSLMARFGVGSEIVVSRSTEGISFRQYKKTKIDAGADLSFPLWKGFSVGTGVQYRDHQINNDYETPFSPPTGWRSLGPTLTLRYQDLSYGQVLTYGVLSSLRYERAFEPGGDDSYDTFLLQAQVYAPLGRAHRIGARIQGFTARGLPPVLDNQVSGKFLKTIGDDVFSNSVLTGQLAFEGIPLHFSWGAPTVVLFYEGGVFRDQSPGSQDPYYWVHGPGAGFRIYLTRVAVPAFGFDVTYSFSTQKVYGFVNVGFQM